jgi:integrase
VGEVVALPGTGRERTLRSAAEAFLEGVGNPNTKRAYRTLLTALAAEFGADAGLDVLEGEAGADRVAAWFSSRWGSAAANTVNTRMRGLSSAYSWWSKQGWLVGDPLRRLTSRPVPPDRTRALTRAVVQELLGRDGVALREKTLWRLLYESAARASEVLELDVEDLDLANRRARVRRKGGAIDTITWQTPTARLLPRLLDCSTAAGRDRCSSPIAGRRVPRPGRCRSRIWPRMAAGVCPTGGRRSSSSQPPVGRRCTSCGTPRSPTPPRMAPRCRC